MTTESNFYSNLSESSKRQLIALSRRLHGTLHPTFPLRLKAVDYKLWRLRSLQEAGESLKPTNHFKSDNIQDFDK